MTRSTAAVAVDALDVPASPRPVAPLVRTTTLDTPAPPRLVGPPMARTTSSHPGTTLDFDAGARIFAVDSRPLLRSGLARMARRAFGTGSLPLIDLEQAAAAARLVHGGPRALLLGLRTGDDPAELVQRAGRIAPVVVLVFDRSDQALARAALAAGADGCMLVEEATTEALRATIEAADSGMPAVSAQLRDEFAQGGQSASAPITARCREVLRALADGLHDDEIAERLGVSTSSVRKHIANAQQRLDARTRTQAVARAAREGLL